MLEHMAVHNASHAFAAVGQVTQPEPEAIPSSELVNYPRRLSIPSTVDRFEPQLQIKRLASNIR
jgi:hypothetical protein